MREEKGRRIPKILGGLSRALGVGDAAPQRAPAASQGAANELLVREATRRLAEAREEDRDGESLRSRAIAWGVAGSKCWLAGMHEEAAEAKRESIRLHDEADAQGVAPPEADDGEDGPTQDMSAWALSDLMRFRRLIEARGTEVAPTRRLNALPGIFLDRRIAGLEIPASWPAALERAEAAFLEAWPRRGIGEGDASRALGEAVATWHLARAWVWCGDAPKVESLRARATDRLALAPPAEQLGRMEEWPPMVPCLRAMGRATTPGGAAACADDMDEAIAGTRGRYSYRDLPFLRVRLVAALDPGSKSLAAFRRAFPQLQHVLSP